MINEIIEKLKNKNIAILGFGKEGKSSYKFIRKYLGNINLTIIDSNDKSGDEIFNGDQNVNFVYGDKYLNNLDSYDLIIKTPGISLNYLEESYYEKIKNKITSQLELLLEVNKKNIIGITGTKGKSTTSSLLYEVIKDQGRDVILAGNIGVPVLDEIENYKENTILVIEMSSHQLEFVKCSPHIGIILNLYQDHLDHAKTLEHYHENKMNMFRYQSENDYAFYSSDNTYTLENIEKLNNYCSFKAIKYDVRFDNEDIHENAIRISSGTVYLNGEAIYIDKERNIIGDHNLKDIMFVVGVAKILGLDLEKAANTIYSFKPLAYRMEKIGTFDGVTYYVDTIATIPEATIGAIKSLPNIDTLIFGGENRDTDYTEFISFLNNCDISNLICMYDTGSIIHNKLDKNKNIYFTRDMREAYKIAKEVTKPNKVCILSPAASSKDVFIDYQEKGELFKSLVLNKETNIKEHPKS